jgi:AraC-like DNA-binding protein
MVDAVIETTDNVEEHRRFDFWKDTVIATADVDLPSDRSSFDARRQVVRMAKGSVIDTSSDPVAIRRREINIARDGLDQVCVAAVLSGGGFHDQLDHNVRAGKGDCIIADLGRPMHLVSSERYREVRLYVPRKWFNANFGLIDNLAGHRLGRGQPLVDLFVGYLGGYASSLPTMSDAEADIGFDALLHLFQGLGSSMAGDALNGGDHLSTQVVIRLGDKYILDHLGNADLNASTMIRALGISRTKLYAAFACRGGINAAIRDARLDKVRRRLNDRLQQNRTIEDIAFDYGFRDYTSFHRAFRRRFGATPRDIRGGLPL